VVAALLAVVMFAVFSCGLLIGMKLAWNLKPAGLTNEQEALVKHFGENSFVYFCKSTPSCFHVQPACGGTSNLKPVNLCSFCFTKLKKNK
jgi:hypothetical protein